MQLYDKITSKNQETGTSSVYVQGYTNDDENWNDLIASFWIEFFQHL